jgi:DAK2 domain fusion protein YloV
MRSALASVNGANPASAHDVAAALARGATYGARGNSGIIMSQVLRGMAESSASGPLTGVTLRTALRGAARLARGAVSVPVEGTIVTVLDCAAAAATECPDDAPLAVVTRAASDAAAAALARTTAQLSALREAGVVDAGARGLLVLLDALLRVTTGTAPERPAFPQATPPERPQASAAPPLFEVMYLLRDTDDDRIAVLRRRLDELGDSVTMVGDGDAVWSAHVHCADAGGAIEAGVVAGTLSQVRVTGLAGATFATPAPTARQAGPAGQRAVLTLAAGDGAARLFEQEGAAVLRCDEPVTATELLAAIRALPHREVLVLPNGALPAPELVAVGVAARDARRDVLMLPSSSMVQGLAALAMHDPARIAVDDAFAMSEAAATTRWGALRIARERALTLVGTCAAGDGLGLIGHEVVVIEADALVAGRLLIDRVLGLGGELVTMLIGADALAGFVDRLCEHIAERHPGVEVTAYVGGQHGDLLQLGVE